MRGYKKLFLVLLLGSFTLTGCIGVNRSFRSIRNHILSNVSVDYEREIEFSIGPAGIFLASMFISFAETEENVDDMLRQISRVQIGVYKNENRDKLSAGFSLIKSLSKNMEERGWTFIVRSMKEDEAAAVFIRTQAADEITQVFVIAIQEEEMVLAEVHGDLSDLIEIAIREHGLNL